MPPTAESGRAGQLPVVIAMVPRPNGITGVHTHVHQFSSYLERAGVQQQIVTPHSWGERPAGWGRLVLGPLFAVRILLERVNGSLNVRWYRWSHEFFLRRALRRRLATAGPCVIYAQCPVSARAALRSRRAGQRLVMAVHFRTSQADEWADKGQIATRGRTFRAIRALEADVVPRADGLVYVSAWARRALTEWLPEAAGVRDTVIDNFVDAPVAAGGATEGGDLVTVGNLEAIKNHRYLLQILSAAAESGRRLTLDVYGEGVEHGNLVVLADRLGLRDQVRLHGFRRDVRRQLPGYRAYVHASYSESSSLAIIEAMAAGLPVLTGDTGPLTELIDDGVEGRFWPLDDARRAADVLLGLVDDDEARQRACEAARRRFARDFDAEVIAPRLLGFLRGATIAGRGATSPPGTDAPRAR